MFKWLSSFIKRLFSGKVEDNFRPTDYKPKSSDRRYVDVVPPETTARDVHGNFGPSSDDGEVQSPDGSA